MFFFYFPQEYITFSCDDVHIVLREIAHFALTTPLVCTQLPLIKPQFVVSLR